MRMKHHLRHARTSRTTCLHYVVTRHRCRPEITPVRDLQLHLRWAGTTSARARRHHYRVGTTTDRDGAPVVRVPSRRSHLLGTMADLATGPSPRDRTLHLTPLVMDVGRTTDPPATAAGLETLHRVSAEETSTVMTVLHLHFPPISAVVDPEVDAISAVHPDVAASSMSGRRSLKSVAMDLSLIHI